MRKNRCRPSLRNSAALLCTAFALLLAALQVSSFWYAEVAAARVTFKPPHVIAGVVVNRGSVIAVVGYFDQGLLFIHQRAQAGYFSRELLGFGWVYGGSYGGAGVPCVVMAALLGWLAWKLARRRDLPPGICRVCGYDLRASPDRCPECGSAVPRHRDSSSTLPSVG